MMYVWRLLIGQACVPGRGYAGDAPEAEVAGDPGQPAALAVDNDVPAQLAQHQHQQAQLEYHHPHLSMPQTIIA